MNTHWIRTDLVSSDTTVLTKGREGKERVTVWRQKQRLELNPQETRSVLPGQWQVVTGKKGSSAMLLEREPLCQYLYHRPLVSRTLKEYIPLVCGCFLHGNVTQAQETNTFLFFFSFPISFPHSKIFSIYACTIRIIQYVTLIYHLF